MKRIFIYLPAALLALGFCQCKDSQKTEGDSTAAANTVSQRHAPGGRASLEAKERAEAFKATLTDTTFLQIAGGMSHCAIDFYRATGMNKDYALNQLKYLTALERAKKHLTCADNQLSLKLNSGKEIRISEDLFVFIKKLVADWNASVREGTLQIVQNEQTGVYDVAPVRCRKLQR